MQANTIELVDRSEMKQRLKERLQIDPHRTAILAVDMHRGHLDPEVATMPAPPEQCRPVADSTVRLFDLARDAGVLIIHAVLEMRSEEESMVNPFWRAVEAANEVLTPGRSSTINDHNRIGSVQTTIMPELSPREGDIVITHKKRLDSFYGTDLELVLRVHGIETLIIVGINTNTCVQNAAFAAFNRDLQVVVVSDCVASMYGDDLHTFGLENISRCFGWVLTLDEVAEELGPNA
jgi:nicotinamidase-related amidase